MALLRAGVCVGDLQDKGYPDAFVKAMREAALPANEPAE